MRNLPYPAQVALIALMLLPVATWAYFEPAYAWAFGILGGAFYGMYRMWKAQLNEVRRTRMPEKLDGEDAETFSRRFNSIVNREWRR